MSLTVAILCQDEERNIEAAIASASFADEVLIVDGGSKDRSIQVAIAAGARVLERPFDAFARQRNFALEHATGKWVFFLDADERITPTAASQIAAAVARCDADAYRIERISVALGERLDWHPGGRDAPIRLMKRTKARFEGAVHERCIVDGELGELAGPIEHRTHRNISELVRKIDRYSTLEAGELVERGAKVLPAWRVLWTMTTTAWRYWRQGLRRHGMAGAIEAISLAYDMALVSAKIWEQKHRDQIDQAYSDERPIRR
jgi:glycosyltransferase involved in cell wall biosynthesis